MNQKEAFLTSEGNNYYNRNQPALTVDSTPEHIKFFKRYIKNGTKILEIGCANGRNLNCFSSFDCDFCGIDPSVDAINDGNDKYKNLNLSVGTADNLQFEDDTFDFVLFGFCLYLVDRKLISHVVSEADRVLKNKGYLGIVDFDSKYPKIREYKYLKGINSYKMDYSQLFLVYPHYSFVEKYPFSHKQECFSEDATERVASIILYKDLDYGYFIEEDE
jgi:ubiquinone/menaquinone biosynthesis C-methylase UbiE